MEAASDYQDRLEAESKKWNSHLKIEADADVLGDNWLGHPLITEHYYQRGLLDWGTPWPGWVREHLSGPAERSLDLGCGTADRSLDVFKAGATRHVEGVDISAERLAEASNRLREKGIPGTFHEQDVNSIQLPANTYDLIFAYHSFHHFVELEHIMEQVHQALTPGGLFIL